MCFLRLGFFTCKRKLSGLSGFYSQLFIQLWLQGATNIQNRSICLPTVTAATTGETITDRVTPPAMAKFRLCFEMSLPSYRL